MPLLEFLTVYAEQISVLLIIDLVVVISIRRRVSGRLVIAIRSAFTIIVHIMLIIRRLIVSVISVITVIAAITVITVITIITVMVVAGKIGVVIPIAAAAVSASAASVIIRAGAALDIVPLILIGQFCVSLTL